MTAEVTPERPALDQSIQKALSVSVQPGQPSPLYTSLTFAWRALVKIRRVPDFLGNAVVFPIVFTLVFTFLLGGAIAGSPADYLQFFLPGVMVMAVMTTSMQTGVALNADISTGIFARVRSLPIWRPSVLVGSLLGDVVRYALASVVPLLLGLIIGFHVEGGLGGVVLALLLLQLFTFSLAWLWTLLGVVMPDPTAVQGVSYLLQFFLMFGSNILVMPETMPNWLETIVNVNPVTHVGTAVRGLLHDTITTEDAVWALVSCAALLVLFVPPAMLLYNRKR